MRRAFSASALGLDLNQMPAPRFDQDDWNDPDIPWTLVGLTAELTPGNEPSLGSDCPGCGSVAVGQNPLLGYGTSLGLWLDRAGTPVEGHRRVCVRCGRSGMDALMEFKGRKLTDEVEPPAEPRPILTKPTPLGGTIELPPLRGYGRRTAGKKGKAAPRSRR